MKNILQVHTSEKKLSIQMAAAQSWYHRCGISQCGEKGHVDFFSFPVELHRHLSRECSDWDLCSLHQGHRMQCTQELSSSVLAASVLHRKTTVCLSLSNNQSSQISTQVLKAWNACRCKTPKALDLCRVIA